MATGINPKLDISKIIGIKFTDIPKGDYSSVKIISSGFRSKTFKTTKGLQNHFDKIINDTTVTPNKNYIHIDFKGKTL